MKKTIILIIVLAAVAGAIFYYERLRGIWPAVNPAPRNITEIIENNQTPFPLKLPEGFSISIFAKDLPGARVMAFDKYEGNLWVSRTSEGAVTELTSTGERGVSEMRDLNKPHGIAFDPQNPSVLYVAEENRIFRQSLDLPVREKVLDLPGSGGHFTRTIGFGPNNKLYISIGSSCNVCRESDERRASIQVYDPVTKKSSTFAKGLRNSVFFIWDSAGKMWATEMGRDMLGDDLPPDEINIVEEGKNFGWPVCYGKNIHDTAFDKNVYIRNSCMEPFETPSHIDIPAHSAPLGLAFVPANSNWPREYWHNLFVAYHGSWNRNVPTGYKVVRIKLDNKGNYLGTEDFITGWLTEDGALGRPVDILIQPGGIMYISDDKAGVIYRVMYKK